jgi:hypothetical protein
MFKFVVTAASIANCAGGVVLIATWGLMSERVPIVVLFIGLALLIQGAFTLLYIHGELEPWGDLATGAFFAGEGLSACVGLGMLALGIIHNVQHDDMEMAPVLAGLLMLVQAILALLYLVMTKSVTSPISTPRA